MVKELHFMGQKAVSVNIAPVGSVLCVGLLTTCAWMANPTAKTCVLLLGIAISQRCQAATEVGKRKVLLFSQLCNLSQVLDESKLQEVDSLWKEFQTPEKANKM